MRTELNRHHRRPNQSTYRTLAEEKSTDLHNFRTAALSFLHVQATPNTVICAYPSQSSSCQYHERESHVPISLFVTLFLAPRQSLLWPTVNMKYPFSRRRLCCSRKFPNFNYIWPADKNDKKKIYFHPCTLQLKLLYLQGSRKITSKLKQIWIPKMAIVL